MKMVKLPTMTTKHIRKEMACGEAFYWVESPAFFLNPRGVLIHRVMAVCTIRYTWNHKNGTVPEYDHHHHVTYLCQNGCNFDAHDEDSKFYSDPPKDRLLCSACENQAVRHGLPPAAKLAGRHVHIGVLRAHRLCCGGDPK